MPARSALGAAFLVAMAGAAAAAEPATRPSGPIDIAANEAEVVNSKCMTVWRGAAEALQADTRLRADTITVYAKPKAASADGQPACGATDRIEADGHVYYVTPQQRARGDHAVYSQGADEIVLTGDVIVVQGDNVARGERLVIKVSTREARMESGGRGTGRVRGVFYPDKSGAVGGPAGTTPAP